MNAKIIEQAAKTAHEVHRAYCAGIGHKTQPEWSELAEDYKATIISSVELICTGKITSPEEAHQNFVKSKIASGWKFGLEYSIEEKRNPRLCSYEMLEPEDKAKESLFFECVVSFM